MLKNKRIKESVISQKAKLFLKYLNLMIENISSLWILGCESKI